MTPDKDTSEIVCSCFYVGLCPEKLSVRHILILLELELFFLLIFLMIWAKVLPTVA